MVTREVGKQASCKGQTADALLMNGMTWTFHKGIFATGSHHLAQQFIELYGVGCGMIGRNNFIFDVITYGREQSYLITELAKHVI